MRPGTDARPAIPASPAPATACRLEIAATRPERNHCRPSSPAFAAAARKLRKCRQGTATHPAAPPTLSGRIAAAGPGRPAALHRGTAQAHRQPHEPAPRPRPRRQVATLIQFGQKRDKSNKIEAKWPRKHTSSPPLSSEKKSSNPDWRKGVGNQMVTTPFFMPNSKRAVIAQCLIG